jgi:hypothetical protein
VKPVALFARSKNRKDGRHPHCSACVTAFKKEWSRRPKVVERNREYQREFSQTPKRKAQIKAYQISETKTGITLRSRFKLKYKYGLTEDAFKAIFDSQDGACATCRDPFAKPTDAQVDHCHNTGIVRGLLCANCNRALGMVGDDINVLRQMIEYLRRPR